MKCPERERCQLYKTNDNKPPNHDVRDKYPCRYWNEECRHPTQGVKEGDACNIEKRNKAIKEIRGRQND